MSPYTSSPRRLRCRVDGSRLRLRDHPEQRPRYPRPEVREHDPFVRAVQRVVDDDERGRAERDRLADLAKARLADAVLVRLHHNVRQVELARAVRVEQEQQSRQRGDAADDDDDRRAVHENSKRTNPGAPAAPGFALGFTTQRCAPDAPAPYAVAAGDTPAWVDAEPAPPSPNGDDPPLPDPVEFPTR